MKKIICVVGGFILVGAMLTGCDPAGAPTPSPSSSPAPAPSASIPAATPTASAAPAPIPDYGFTFYRGAHIGDNWDQISTGLHHPIVTSPECPWFRNLEHTVDYDTNALWDTSVSATGVDLFYTFPGTAGVTGTFPRNAEGIGIGSTKAEVLAAYPDAVVDTITPHVEATVTRITVNDPHSDAQYAYRISGNYGADVVDGVQWGVGGVGGVWDHYCEGS